MILQDKCIVLGVTGGIAAYKSADLASKLVQAGAVVDVVMTEAATRFIAPLTFQALTRRPVSADMYRLRGAMSSAHVALSERADIVVVAPATANTLAKLAHGLADNLLSATILATNAPVLLAPAMNADMYAKPVTRANLELLKRRGFFAVGPDHGRLASGRVGVGRLVPVERIVEAARMILGREGGLAGLKVLVTAGGTREPLDPVRHLGNRSSGKMGYALARVARDRGAQVTLVSAATGLPIPYGVELRQVETAAEMCEVVIREAAQSDILLMAAAVGDYRPVQVRASKMKKTPSDLVLTLTRTPDVLEGVAVQRKKLAKPELVVGFAAETDDLIANARLKLAAKGLDLVVANDVSADDSGFAVDTNRVVLVAPAGTVDEWPLMDKREVAELLLGRITRMWEERHGQGDERHDH